MLGGHTTAQERHRRAATGMGCTAGPFLPLGREGLHPGTQRLISAKTHRSVPGHCRLTCRAWGDGPQLCTHQIAALISPADAHSGLGGRGRGQHHLHTIVPVSSEEGCV